MFVDKFEGALGKGKGKKLYAFKVMMMKVRMSENTYLYTVMLTLCIMSELFTVVIVFLSEMDQVSERF